MPLRLTLITLLAVAGSCCSGGTGGPLPTAPTGPAAVIILRVPSSVPARVCTRCGDRVGELDAFVDLVVEETAGVGGQISLVRTLLANASGTIEGPGTLGPEQLLQFWVPTVRVNARGSLTIPELGIHFSPDLANRLPATLSFTVTFRDDNGHTMSADAAVQITPVLR